MGRGARILGTLLIAAGLLTLAWATVVWRWEDPVTGVANYLEQRRLEDRYERRAVSFSPGTEQQLAGADPAAVRRALARAARGYRKATERGDAIGRLEIPELGLEVMLVEGTDPETLKRGPGRYRDSAMPGEGKLVYVAGHRTTYGAPFSRIDELAKGDRVTVELPYATIEYVVTGHDIVEDTDLSVLESRGREELALQACHPRFFATQRWITYAKPVRVLPRGAAEPTELLAAAG